MASQKKQSKPKQKPATLKVTGQVAIERVQEVLRRDTKAVFRLVATRARRTTVLPDKPGEKR